VLRILSGAASACLLLLVSVAWAADDSTSERRLVAPGVRLIMVDDLGCPYCARWNAEVGVGYANSGEGRFAPLVRVRKGSAALVGLHAITHTPTFIVVRDGIEIGRITGYPGAHFFWPMLNDILVPIGYQAPRPSD
jgi:thioredoxin-related protein